MTIETIILATDFTEQGRAAEEAALDLALRCGATLHVVHGIEPIMGVSTEDDTSEFEEFYGRLIDRAEAEFEARAARWEHLNLSIKHHVQIGHRWRVVLETAEREDAGLIVLGRRRFAENQHVPLGTTSQKVFYGANRPVMFVPTD